MSVVVYYLVFSSFFDNPIESELKITNVNLKQQLATLKSDVSLLDSVSAKIIERDKNIYLQIFNIDKANFDVNAEVVDLNEGLELLTTEELLEVYKTRTAEFYDVVTSGGVEIDSLHSAVCAKGEQFANIPSIQPIDNPYFDKSIVASGAKINPFYKGVELHKGFDYVVEEGTRVFATADGEVLLSDIKPSYKGGLTVEIGHNNGYVTRYCHLSKAIVNKGEFVKRGEIIGYSGNSGYSFVPHLHYEVLYKGNYLVPSDFYFADLSKNDYYLLPSRLKETVQSCD